ncbi:MAG: CPBP family intramembrane metalloprotease [Chloroflexi bacterium]|nr:CPBP family intramembrane metalloprotease [Chloroflexota bacterium]
MSIQSTNESPLKFFILVFVLSIPIWLISSLLGNKLPIPINLPISALLFLIPVTAASILLYNQNGWHGVNDLLKKVFDYRKIKNKIWVLPALLLAPLIYVLSYAIMRSAGLPLPDSTTTPFLMTPVFFAAFFIGAACEELGWSGYVIDSMQKRWGALTAGIVLGLVWQAWHIIGDLQAQNTAAWIVWHSLYSVGLRILIVWIYNNTQKSVFAAILVHTMDNVSWTLFPNYGSHFDPFIGFIVMTVVVGIIIFLWDRKTLAQYRYLRLKPKDIFQ